MLHGYEGEYYFVTLDFFDNGGIPKPSLISGIKVNPKYLSKLQFRKLDYRHQISSRFESLNTYLEL